MLSVAYLCTIATVYNYKDKLVSYPEVPTTAIVNPDTNCSTGHCSVSAEYSKMNPMFGILQCLVFCTLDESNVWYYSLFPNDGELITHFNLFS